MTKFFCDCTSCMYYDVFENCCTKAALNIIDFSSDGTPDCFKSIVFTPEYRQEYWIAVRIDGKPYRKRTHGKCIKLNGFELFTRERIPSEYALNALGKELPEDVKNITCTEPNTGLAIKLGNVYTWPEKVQAMIAQRPDVMSYPILMEEIEI